MRAGLIATIVAGVVVPAPTRSAQLVAPAAGMPDCLAPRAKVDLAFIIDRSGSLDMNLVGQSYNVQIEGVLRALRDPSVIPRDGSVAVVVETFAGIGTIQVPFKQIDTAADAEAIAAMVESLRCTTTNCTATGLCPVFGSNPASNYAPAITTADTHLEQNHRSGARRALLLSSDGQPSDLDFAVLTAQRVGDGATALGVPFELDVVLVTLDPDAKADAVDPNERNAFEAFNAAKARADKIVYPQPPNNLPGKTLAVKSGVCNKPCASLDDSAVRADCDRQVKEFAERTRSVLRSHGTTISSRVNTEADPAPNTPVIGETLSLRQAIERANCNDGPTNITFANNVQKISPLVPLPALTAPEITICGCDEPTCNSPTTDEQKCVRLVTIDGSTTDATKGEQHSDGVLIRSNRDVVRGLRIIHFKRAGVGIEPVFLSDNVGFNLITRNVFENNVKAGVCVIDPPSGQPSAVVHNIGNTISMNDFSVSGTPIDLACDGPTPNDSGDLDEGPNTLLNFPDKLSVADTLDVTVAASGVSLIGQVTGTTAAGALVEIFAITSFKPVSGGRVIDGVTFLTQAKANASGMFSVTGLPDSPTCGYTATVTDREKNTSELRFPCSGFAKANIAAKELNLSPPDAVPNNGKLSGKFTIENAGCDKLILNSFSVTRIGNIRTKKGGDNDISHFSIGTLTGGETLTIDPGQMQSVPVSFNPLIPRFPGIGKKPNASQSLPSTITSLLTLTHNGCGNGTSSINLTASVKKEVHLIGPGDPPLPALVTLTRSGDEFTVTYFIFDSSLGDILSVDYRFFKASGEEVPATVTDHDLTKPIQERMQQTPPLINGQSFQVIQTFSNATQNPGVTSVEVKVHGSNSFDTGAGRIGALSNTASAQSFRRAQGTTLRLPPLKLTPALHENAQRKQRP